MPVREMMPTGFALPRAEDPVPAEAPSFGETLSAAFSMENDVVNAIELLSKPGFKPVANYPLTQKLKDGGYWDNYRDNFLGVESDEEFAYVASKIEQEQKDRDVLARSGFSGFIAAVGAGMLSPTMVLPLVGPSKGLKAFGEAGVLAFTAGTLQELPLALNQETRTVGETAFSLAASTALGGFLGGSIAQLRKGEAEVITAGMADQPRLTPIPHAVGAMESAAPSAGNLASGAQTVARALDSNPLTRSPVTDSLMSDYHTARWTMAQLADAGLAMEKNALGVPTTPGGTVENAVNRFYGKVYKTFGEIDNAYSDYVFNGNAPGLLRNQRAWLEGARNPQKLSKAEFRAEVTKAGWNNDQHPIPQVAKVAAAVRREFYDPTLKAAQEVGLLSKELKLVADPSYINRVFNHEAIAKDPVAFVNFLAERFNKKLQEEFAQKLEKFQLTQERRSQELADANLPEDQIDELRDVLGNELKVLEEQMNVGHFSALEEAVAALRGAARKLNSKSLADETQRKQMLADARDMERAAGESYTSLKAARAKIKQRLSGLNKAKVVLEERLAKKVEKVERAEELSMTALNRAARAGYRFLSEMDKWSDEVLDAKLSDLKTQFARMAEIYDKGEERIVRLVADEQPADAANLAEVQKGRADKLTDFSERIADAEDLGRPALREMIDDMLQASLQRIQRINDRRAVRTAKLREQAKGLDPAVVQERIGRMSAKLSERQRAFMEATEAAGGVIEDQYGRKVDFSAHAREAAQEVKDKIMATYIRLPTVEVMQSQRGAELTRVLDIPSTDLAPWLETDIEKLIRSHVRTMAPDIEITRKLGTVNGEEQFRQLGEEMNAKLDAISKAVDEKGEPRTEKWKEKETARVQEEFARNKRNLEGVIGRLRHNWGLPKYSDGVAYRMGKAVSNLNVLRYMGGVTISSVPDLARPIMRYGLLSTFKHGFIPYVGRLKQMKLSRQEARLAGVAIDAITSSRAHAFLDVVEDIGRGSKFERGLEYASGKQGIVALFSYWTDEMKTIAASVANAQLTDGIARAAQGKADAKVNTFLAQNGIGPNEIADIWNELAAGGGEKVNGVWLPNTEVWKSDSAKRAYRAALARETNIAIITPGVERPLWVNETLAGKLISQFKSFALSSTYRTLLAGMQQRDMAFANGIMISLALGTLSYYLSGTIKGGEARERMKAADPEKWADEAISRSGVMSVFGLGQDLLSRIPGTAPYVSFSGGRTTRRGGDNLVEAGLGPTFDAITTGADILTELDDPTQSTMHKFRTLWPYQNTIGVSRFWDGIEAAVPLPERRQ